MWSWIKKSVRQEFRETSGLTGDGLQQIKSYLQKTKTVAFIGSSGVGKSTLINRLLGEECLKTNTLRKDDKGRHTTTHRELFLIPDSEKAKWISMLTSRRTSWNMPTGMRTLRRLS